MTSGILGGSSFAWSRNTTEQGRHSSLVSSKITGKCPMSQLNAGVPWILHPSSAAHGWLVVGVCLWHTWKAGSSALLLGPSRICFLEGCRRIDMLGANPMYLLCQHLQHVSILPEKHRLFLAFDSVQCSLPGLVIVSLFPFPPVFVQSDSDLFF